MGIVYNTSKWADMLWHGHVVSNDYAGAILADGTVRQKGFADFAQDVHTSLYQRHMPSKQETAPSWAESLLSEAQALPEYEQLRSRCQNNGFLSGIATQKVLESLIPLLPEPKEEQGQNQDPSTEQGQGAAMPGMQGEGQGGNSAIDSAEAEAMRRKLRIACREAQKEVDTAEQAIDDLAGNFGFSVGQDPGKNETMEDISQQRTLYNYVSQSPIVKKIALLTGKMKRLASSTKKRDIKTNYGGITGIKIGGDLQRILPSELAMLGSSNKMLKMQTIAKIMQKRALQYETTSKEPLAQGPIILCCDESGSMRGARGDMEAGTAPIIWARALAMAMLGIAQEQKRSWHYIGYNAYIMQECTVMHGDAKIEDLCAVLERRPSGDTNFDPPLQRAADILEQDKAFTKADVIFLTDGLGKLSERTEARINALRQKGLAVYVVGIGSSMDLSVLAPIATECYKVISTTTANANEKAADILVKL